MRPVQSTHVVDAGTLRVGFDASAAALARPTGVGLAIAHLARALRARAGGSRLELELLYRLSRARRRAHFLPGPARLYHERLSLLLARGLDVFHGPDSRLPRFSGPALVATVHDLSARRDGFSTDRFRRKREAHWEQVVRRADLVVTYTEAVRREVSRELGIPLERIAAVPLAPTDALATLPGDPGAAVERIVGQRPYVLCLGELSRRKNSVGAVEAFAAAGAPLADHALVLAGPAGHAAEEVERTIERLGLRGRVVRPAYLPAEQVAALLSGAAAFLFPTRYEGFGMPVLEAFRAGVPVVASRDPTVLEVAGGAALHRDAGDAAGLAEALVEVVRDGDQRARWIAAGRTRLEDFSWSRSAERLIAVYRAAHAREPAPAPLEPSTEPSSCSR